MFDFEEDTFERIVVAKEDACDLQLGLALSKSLIQVSGSQILEPSNMHVLVQSKFLALITGNGTEQ